MRGSGRTPSTAHLAAAAAHPHSRPRGGGGGVLPDVELVAVNSGYTLSLLRDHIAELRRLKVPHEGSQFRSRDFFPQVVSDILHGRRATALVTGESFSVDEGELGWSVGSSGLSR